MFESLLSLEEVERQPWLMFIWAVVIGSIGILIAAQINYQVPIGGQWFNLSGIFSVLFVIIPSTYFITTMIKREEVAEEQMIRKYHLSSFWEKHGSYLLILLTFFAGLTIAFSVWSFVLPGDFFSVQSSKINQIQGTTGSLTHGDIGSFGRILMNNLQVTAFSFLFSLFFGAGAVFIIAWNASILGVYIRQLSNSMFDIYMGLFFLPHGIPEIGGYLLAGLAGGIISSAVLRKNDRKVLRIILLDSMKLLALAVAAIFLGAAIEVYL
jgi:uncharacterized membrane protein SpoIIM required for sporulation